MAGETPRVGDYVEPAGGVSFAAFRIVVGGWMARLYT